MRKHIAVFIVIALLVFAGGCSSKTNEGPEIRAVKVMQINSSEKPTNLNYIGTVDSREITKYSFKTPGQIGREYVDKGERVKTGDKLMALDMEDIDFQVSAAQATMEAAQANVKKAAASLDYARDYIDKIVKLYAAGGASQDQKNQVQLQKDMAETTYSQAVSQYNAAQTDYDYKLSMQREGTIYAEHDGVVVELLSRENERVAAYYPVIVVRSAEQVINVGIPQQDINKVKLGSTADINVDGQKAGGIATNIAEAPDQTTRTYNAEITVKEKDFRLGSIANVNINTGQQKGIWIPISAVSASGGEDYIYIVKDKRAFKRTVETLKQSENNIMVKGVKVGEYMVISGMKNLNDGARVNIVE